jgi:hypothetical protein
VSEEPKDEVTKALLTTSALKLEAVVDNGKLRIGANNLEGERLSLREDEYLTIEVDSAHRVVVTRRPKPKPELPSNLTQEKFGPA